MAIIGLTAFITATTTGDIGDIASRSESSQVTYGGLLSCASLRALAATASCFNFQNQRPAQESTHQQQAGPKASACTISSIDSLRDVLANSL
jgi:hypothetical protein